MYDRLSLSRDLVLGIWDLWGKWGIRYLLLFVAC